MRNLTIITTIASVGLLAGCGLLKQPAVTAGYNINFEPNSQSTVNIGTQNSQSNAIYSPLGLDNGAEAEQVADKSKSKGGAFINTATGDRSADIDAIAAIEKIEKAKNITAGQSIPSTKGDESPASGDQTQNPTQSDSKETNIPVTVRGGEATTN